MKRKILQTVVMSISEKSLFNEKVSTSTREIQAENTDTGLSGTKIKLKFSGKDPGVYISNNGQDDYKRFEDITEITLDLQNREVVSI